MPSECGEMVWPVLFLLILPEAGAKFKLKLKRKDKETFNRHEFAPSPTPRLQSLGKAPSPCDLR